MLKIKLKKIKKSFKKVLTKEETYSNIKKSGAGHKKTESTKTKTKPWDLSSAGRASALQAEGHRFEPCRSHSCKEQEIIRNGEIAQLARARGSYPRCRGFESPSRYEVKIQKFLKRVFGFFIFQKSVFFVDFTGYL